MPDTPRELRPMSSFNPSEPGILHDRVTDTIEAWTGEDEAEYRRNAIELPDGAVALYSTAGATSSAVESRREGRAF